MTRSPWCQSSILCVVIIASFGSVVFAHFGNRNIGYLGCRSEQSERVQMSFTLPDGAKATAIQHLERPITLKSNGLTFQFIFMRSNASFLIRALQTLDSFPQPILAKERAVDLGTAAIDRQWSVLKSINLPLDIRLAARLVTPDEGDCSSLLIEAEGQGASDKNSNKTQKGDGKGNSNKNKNDSNKNENKDGKGSGETFPRRGPGLCCITCTNIGTVCGCSVEAECGSCCAGQCC